MQGYISAVEQFMYLHRNNDNLKLPPPHPPKKLNIWPGNNIHNEWAWCEIDGEGIKPMKTCALSRKYNCITWFQ